MILGCDHHKSCIQNAFKILYYFFKNVLKTLCINIWDYNKMKFIKYMIAAALSFSSLSNSLSIPRTVIDHVFRKVSHTEVINTFKVLKVFSLSKSGDENMYRTEQEYFQNCATLLDKGISFVKSTKEECIYLAWTPYAPMYNKTLEFDETALIIRNDCDGVDFKLVPLYYVILTNREDKIEIDRIFPNPAIEVRLDLKLLKKQLDQLTEISGVPINYDKLKYYDNGRYYFEFLKDRPGSWSIPSNEDD